MSLPSGFIRLEWIESTGTQYVDTELVVNAETVPGFRVEADIEIIETSGVWSVSGCGNGDPTLYIGVRADGNYGFGNGTADMTTGLDYEQSRKQYVLDVQNSKYAVDGVFDLQVSFSTPSGSQNYMISAYSALSQGVVCHKEKIYGYKFYSYDTLIRDFRPCKNTSGEIGLWDDVNSVFYANAGTGEFIAGPEVVIALDPPVKVEQIINVKLAWTAVDGATSYRVYRDGVLLAETTETVFVDESAELGQTYVYGISACNRTYESAQTELTVYTREGYAVIRPVVASANFP